MPGQRAPAWSYLKDFVRVRDLRRTDDTPCNVFVDQEVLSKSGAPGPRFVLQGARGWSGDRWPSATGVRIRRAVHRPSIPSAGVSNGSDSSQVVPRRPKITAYRCFLPNLTGFTALRRAGPNSQHQKPPTEAAGTGPQGGIQPRYSGLRVQGTAISPPSTTSIHTR